MCINDDRRLELKELAQGLVERGKELKDFESICFEYDINRAEYPYFAWQYLFYATRHKKIN